jgi:MFS family permease
MAFVLYLDRVCIGQAVGPIQRDLGLSDTRMGVVLMAFTLAYGLFEVPTGRWGDRFGSRRVLTRIVLWWSAFTALTGACVGFWSLLVVRFLFGAGEAGAYPNAARVLARWSPAGERGRYQGLFLAASLVGGSIAPALAGELIAAVGWRWTFVAFGATGVLWVIAFSGWYRDDPAGHPAVNAAERRLIGAAGPAGLGHGEPVPWRRVLADHNLWLLGTIISLSAFNSYVYFSWYPRYLEAARGLDNRTAGWLASLVLTGGALGTLGGGLIGDRITRRAADRPRARRRYCAGAFSAAAVLLQAGILCESPVLTSLLAGASCLAMMSQQPTWWTCATEVGGRHLGALFGLMNGMGVVGAMGSQFFFGAFADWRGRLGYDGRERWDPAFGACLAALVVAAACWGFVNTERRPPGA